MKIDYMDRNGSIKYVDVPEESVGAPESCNVLPVVFFSDNNTMAYVVRAIWSLFKHKKPGYRVLAFLYIYHNPLDMLPITVEELDMIGSSMDDCTLVVEPFPDVFRESLANLNYHTGTKYYCGKFFTPKLFPSLPWCMAFDADIMFIGDVRDKLSGYSEDFPMISVALDPYKRNNKPYGNAGVQLLNLDKCRSFGYTERCIEHRLSTDGRKGEGDQGTVNEMFNIDPDRRYLPQELNVDPQAPRIDDPYDIVCLHYMGRPKLFNKKFVNSSYFSKRIIYEADLFDLCRKRFIRSKNEKKEEKNA